MSPILAGSDVVQPADGQHGADAGNPSAWLTHQHSNNTILQELSCGQLSGTKLLLQLYNLNIVQRTTRLSCPLTRAMDMSESVAEDNHWYPYSLL